MLALVVAVGALLAFVPGSLSTANRNGWKGVGKSGTVLIDEDERLELDDDVMTLLQSVAHQLASLRAVIHNLKVHNQMIYKHLNKMHQEKCHRAPKRDLTWTAYQNYEAADDDVAEEATVRSPVEGCLPGFHQNPENLKCYRVFSDQRVSWRVARDRCKSSGAELVSIQSSRDQSFISELLRKKNAGKCDYWTGLTTVGRKATASYQLHSHSLGGTSSGPGGRRMAIDDTRFIWYWSGDGTRLSRYTNWNDNEPNNISEGGDGRGADDVCVQMLWIFNWKWNDAICTESSACFICQTPPPPPAKNTSFRRQ